MSVGVGTSNPGATLEVTSPSEPPTLRMAAPSTTTSTDASAAIEFGSYSSDGQFTPGASIRATTGTSGGARRSLTPSGPGLSLTGNVAVGGALSVNQTAAVGGALTVGMSSSRIVLCSVWVGICVCAGV